MENARAVFAVTAGTRRYRASRHERHVRHGAIIRNGMHCISGNDSYYPRMTRTRTIAYLRVSTDKQADRGVSLDAQRAKVAAYAELYDLDVIDLVVDAGVSAKTLDRPGLLPANRCDCEFLLDLILLERTLDDIGRDMARRPDWMIIPLRALLRMLEPEGQPPSNQALGV